jgi:hypothetical protein
MTMDTLIPPQPAVQVEQADSFVVVSLWRAHDDGCESYDYQPCVTLNDALDAYREYEDGEYPRARAIGIFPARNGMPIGGRMEPALLARLMKETRAR